MGYSDRALPPMVYVSGPMTGYRDFNYPAFFEAEKRLRDVGYNVINPAAFGGGEQTGLDYSGLIKRDLRLLLECTGVATLPGWSQSNGASTEVYVAKTCGIITFPVDWWIDKAAQTD